MLQRRHRPRLEEQTADPLPTFGHLDRRAVSMLAWLRASRVEFVLVGPVAAAIRGPAARPGPVAIVPAPYGRNFERLAEALAAEHACARADGSGGSVHEARLSADALARGQLRTLRLSGRDLDIEGVAPGMPSYQELLYEAGGFEVAAGVSVEVASPEDIERYDHLRRTGIAPEIRIRRSGVGADAPATRAGEDASVTRADETAPAPTEAHLHD